MQKPSILIISHRLPYPLNSGGKQAIFNSITAIKEDYEVYLTYSEDVKKPSETDVKAFLAAVGCQVTLLPFSSKPQSRKSWLLKRVVHRIALLFKHSRVATNPYSFWLKELRAQPKQFIDHINHIIKERDIDIVQCEMLSNISFVNNLPASVKKVFVHHELGFVRHELELKNAKDQIEIGRETARKAKQAEIEQLNKYDCIITLSTIDQQKLISAGCTTAIQSSFAIVDASATADRTPTNPLELVFVGPDSHEPNYVGLCWFLNSCWNQLLAKNSNYHLTIVGKWKKQNMQELSARYPHLSFSGFVDNLSGALAGKIMIVPITVGSGIRMKILEAANLGIPFVSTSVGAEGIPVKNGEHCYIADEASVFVDALIKLHDPFIQLQFVQNSMKLIKERFSMEALRQNRIAIYRSLYETK